MRRKPVIPRRIAQRDVEDAIDCYLKEASALVAEGFVDALEQACAHIAGHPATGSPRYAHELDLPGVRSWPLKHYPLLVFYVEQTALALAGTSLAGAGESFPDFDY